MDPVLIIIDLEIRELSLQVYCSPEKNVVEIFATKGPNEPLDKRVRQGRPRDRRDFLNIDDAQIGFPAMMFEQRIVVGTQALDGWPKLSFIGCRTDSPSGLQ